MRFRKITEDRVDPTRVTLRVVGATDGTVHGRVSTLAFGETGVELMSTEGVDPPIATALELATALAHFKEQDVDVVDAGGLWQAAWGKLEG